MNDMHVCGGHGTWLSGANKAPKGTSLLLLYSPLSTTPDKPEHSGTM